MKWYLEKKIIKEIIIYNMVVGVDFVSARDKVKEVLNFELWFFVFIFAFLTLYYTL